MVVFMHFLQIHGIRSIVQLNGLYNDRSRRWRSVKAEVPDLIDSKRGAVDDRVAAAGKDLPSAAISTAGHLPHPTFSSCRAKPSSFKLPKPPQTSHWSDGVDEDLLISSGWVSRVVENQLYLAQRSIQWSRQPLPLTRWSRHGWSYRSH